MIIGKINIFGNALYFVLPIIGLVVGVCAGIALYILIKRKQAGEARLSAEKWLEEEIEKAKTISKEMTLEAKEEILKQKTELDKEIRERRNETQRIEQRLAQKEDLLDKKDAQLDKKLEGLEQQKNNLVKQQEEIQAKKRDVELAHEQAIKEIENAAQMTREEAKNHLIEAIMSDAKRDIAKQVFEMEQLAKTDAARKAKEIISLAIQKCSVDHSSEIAVSVVNLPNDDMKGRIIGREGRNIRALENATGVDLIIDDTPEAVVLSGFDPVRREIARITLESLITDGRIHPTRIEEMVEKSKRELDVQIREAGENASYETGVFNLHPDIVKLLGRLKFRTSYGQNVLKHSIEVSRLAGLMAQELGADVQLAKRAGLLHDIGKAVDFEVEGTHITIGADLAKKYKESKAIIHCIAAHHNDIEPETMEAVLVQCADSISGSRPGARRESLDTYVKRLEKLESIANNYDGVEKSYAIQAGREIRILVRPEVVDEAALVFMAKEIASQIENELDYPGQIKVNLIRETRCIEYAK